MINLNMWESELEILEILLVQDWKLHSIYSISSIPASPSTFAFAALKVTHGFHLVVEFVQINVSQI